MEFLFEQTVPARIDEVFAFHSHPSHLAVLMRGRPGFRLLRHDGSIRPGCQTWFEETIGFCIPVVLGFRHAIHEPLHRFGEELVHGPFSGFSHVHEFEDLDGTTVVRDRLDVRLPRIFGGAWAVGTVVAPVIRKVFALRHRVLLDLAASGW